MAGQPICIDTSVIDKVVAIRGKDESNGTRFEAYLGYKINAQDKSQQPKTYTAKLLALNTKSTADGSHGVPLVFEHASILGSLNGLGNTSGTGFLNEVCKCLDPKDRDNNSPVLKAKMKELFNPEAKEQKMLFGARGICDALVYDEAILISGCLFSNKVYWTEKENKLKGITYNSRK
jgi:hypothetical protein